MRGPALMRRILLGIVLLSIVVGVAYWRERRHAPAAELAYAAARKVTIWSSNAQVRVPLQVVNFGDRLEIERRSGENVDVRTKNGVEGWVASHDLIPADLWQRLMALTAQARSMPVQARAHTKVLSNLRVEPGPNSARVYQLVRDTPVAILARKVIDVPAKPAAVGQNDDEGDTGEPATTKKEDWLFVLADTKDSGQLAGWVVGRFLETDLPPPLPDYASSAGMHVAGW